MRASHAGHAPRSASPDQHHERGTGMHYVHLAIMTILSFAAMYVLMYAMVNSLENVFANVNQFYMAGLMAAAMVAIELGIMWSMYPSRRANVAIIVAGFVALGAFWGLIRAQSAVGDEQFLKSMIPHHAGAVLMCRKASIQDAEIQALCKEIISSQQREIGQMKSILARLEE